MADSTTNLNTVSSTQSAKEITINELFDAASPATLFGRNAVTTSGLTWGYYGGDMLVDGVLTSISNGTVVLTASTTNYVEATAAGVVSKNTTGFTAGRIPLYSIVTGTSSVTSYSDQRVWVDPRHIAHKVSISITSADVTMTAAQARARHIILSGTLTGDRSLIVPDSGEWVVYNNTSGAFSVTVKTSAGTGDTVVQGENRSFFADGTNVIATTTGGGSSVNSFATIAVSGQSDVVADSSTDTLTLVAGTGITLTTNAGSDSVTITNSGTASNSFTTIAVSGQSDVVADSATDTLTLVAGSNITLTTNADTDTITIAASGGGGGGSITLGTPQPSTSGTSIDFTSIPAGTKRIDVMFNGVSVSGTSPIIVQLGDSGGAENTGYTGAVSGMSSTVSTATLSSGFALSDSGTSAAVLNGTLHLTLLNSSTFLWSATGLFGRSNSAAMFICGGIKALSAELDRIRITCVNGTDTFDAGSINIQYM
jgi:hypothetical protein